MTKELVCIDTDICFILNPPDEKDGQSPKNIS